MAEISVFINGSKDASSGVEDDLKPGHPILFYSPSMVPLEEPNYFLTKYYVESGSRRSKNTWATAAHSLAGWLEFLPEIEVADCFLAESDHLLAYRDAYATAISPFTQRPYSASTISLRIGFIEEFYRFAQRQGWYSGSIIDAHLPSQSPRRTLDSTMLAHLGTIAPQRSASGLRPKIFKGQCDIRPLLMHELKPFLHAAGPRASEQDPSATRSSRNRLLVDIAIFTGMRLDEIHGLKIYPFLTMRPDPAAPGQAQGITIVGKGAKARRIAIPNWLVEDILAYIGNERERSVAAGERPRGPIAKSAAGALFMTHPESRPGRPLGRSRMQKIVYEICMKAGLVDLCEKTDPKTGATFTVIRPKHSIHDLRHTYAVLTYIVRKQLGDSEPWKMIQSQLGHRFLATTVETYLHYAGIFGLESNQFDIRRFLSI